MGEEARWVRPMRARDPAEPHRAATPLELFFDLCFVVAVSLAAARLHHALAETHLGAGLTGYLTAFFAIWWAWMNFTWFASAYDTDDGLYRLTTLVQITGALVLAAGVPSAFDRHDFTVITAGYVIMRLAMVAQWLRAGAANPHQRRTTRRFAVGIAVVQLGWVLRLFLPSPWTWVAFVLLTLAELAVPVVAERAGPTSWHPGHIAERYGCFTLIVLGEVVLAVATAIEEVLGEPAHGSRPLTLAAAGIVIVFALWWLYFAEPGERLLTSLPTALGWGYGHYLVFASVAAVGAGLEVAVDVAAGRVALGPPLVGLATAVPVAVFLVCLTALHLPAWSVRRVAGVGYPLVAALVLASAWTPVAHYLIAALLAALVVARLLGARLVGRRPGGGGRDAGLSGPGGSCAGPAAGRRPGAGPPPG